MMKQCISMLLLAVMFFSCKSDITKVTESEETVASKSADDDWIILFDGTSTEGWRGYNGKTLPPGWIAKDGALTFVTELGLEQDPFESIDDFDVKAP